MPQIVLSVFLYRQKIPLPLFSTILLTVTGLTGIMISAVAQEVTTACQPPKVGEYLLLVVSPTTESQDQLRRALPSNISGTICQYLNDTVTRIDGFTQKDNANAQARYINDVVGLSAFVATLAREKPPQNPPAYSPKPLGIGYAVLVDYFNNPEIAQQLRQVLGNDVGLVSYGQRPYIMAVHTSDRQNANSILQTLSDRGFFAMLVDSRKVMVLRAKVTGSQ